MKIRNKKGKVIIFFEKNDCGFTFLMTSHIRIFTDCGDWFIYLLGKKRIYRLSSAGNYVRKIQVIDFMEGKRSNF